jgi:DNA-binding NtrC family response regulator
MLNRIAKILLVDDEESILFSLKMIFEDFDVTGFLDSTQAITSLKNGNKYDLLIVDYRLQNISGLEILVEAKRQLKSYKAILLTAYSNRELLEQVINNNLVCKVINKPFIPQEILDLSKDLIKELEVYRKGQDHVNVLQEQLEYFQTLSKQESAPNTVLIHRSELMKEVLNKATKYGHSNANVMIVGECGSGKEVIANIVHKSSKRADSLFLKINCSAIPESLAESELFGYEKGAFTGAISKKSGKFKLAEGGTIFLDEVAELPLGIQAKLLRVIENKEILPLGAASVEKVDVRIICACNKDLQQLVEKGLFREDLFHRLNLLQIRVPPLRDRRADIPLIALYFLNKIEQEEGGAHKEFEKDALDYLSNLDLTGNVRELRNLVYKVYLIVDEPQIKRSNLDQIANDSCFHGVNNTRDIFECNLSLSEFREKITKDYIIRQLHKNNYKLTDTAKVLQIQLSNLSRLLKSLNINWKDNRSVSI